MRRLRMGKGELSDSDKKGLCLELSYTIKGLELNDTIKKPYPTLEGEALIGTH